MNNPTTVANDVLKALASAGRVTKEQVERARAELQARGGLPWTHLVAAGVPPADVLSALSQVTQIPAAPVDRMRKANRATAAGIDGAACWRLLAAPFASDNGTLEVAFADPRVLAEAKNVLPPHKPYVALEAHVRTMLNGLFPQAQTGAKPIPLSEVATGPHHTTNSMVAAGEQKLAEMVGQYKIERRIGEGGMASVFLARDTNTQKPVALKVMKDHLTNDATFVQRFAAEARATVGMRHQNIVEVLSYGDEGGRYFMACEFIDGGTVDELLTRQGKLPAPLAAEIFAQMLQGLSFAHGKNIVHRDLKPANLLLHSSGSVKVSDFGIAKTEGGAALTQTGLLIGTAAFMSPEQAQGQPVDTRSDLFTAGIILWQLLTGQNPFDAESPTTSIVRIISGSYPLIREAEPTVPTTLETVIERLMQRDPAARYQSAGEVLAELEPYLADVRRRFPTLIADALKAPAESKRQLLDADADALVAEAKPLMDGTPADRARAALLLYRASLLSPAHPEAPPLLTLIMQKESYRFGASQSPKILELERVLAETPDAPGPLQQIAQLYRMEGNLERAVIYLKKYLRLRPKDGYAATQLQQLTGEKFKAVSGPTPVQRTGQTAARTTGGNPAYRTGSNPSFPSPGRTGGTAIPNQGGTAGLVAGIKTGGFQANPNSNIAPPPSGTEQAPEGVTFYAPGMDAPEPEWKKLAKKAAPYVFGLLALIFVVKLVGKLIDKQGKELGDKTWELHEKMAESGSGKMVQDINKLAEQQLRETGKSEIRGARKLMENIDSAMAEGRYQDAVSNAQVLINDYPQSSDAESARMSMINAYIGMNSVQDAQKQIGAYLELYPQGRHYPEAVIRRGELAIKAGQPRQAIGDFTEVVKNWNNSPFYAEALTLRGITRKQLGERDDAAADLNAAVLKAQPGSAVHAKAQQALQSLGE